MSNLSSNTVERPFGKGGRKINVPVDAGSHIYRGGLCAQLDATAMLVQGSTASSGSAIGVATMEQDASSGSDGDKRCELLTDQIMIFANATAGDACSESTKFGSVVYMYDDHTIADNSAGGTRQAAGYFAGMEPNGDVRVYVCSRRIAIQDSQSIDVSLHSLREVDASGDVGAIAANGGILASDTTPIMRGDANESLEISWATGNVDPVQFQITLPKDFDGSEDVTLDLEVYSGSTDAATFTVETSWNGGTQVSDSADDSATKSATPHVVTATIAAADVPDAARRVTVALTPAAHATNTIQIVGVRLNYKKSA